MRVIGNATITGYVNLDVYFETEDGPVLVKVEAYVVKGMSAPFIFGNDFADQYSISLIREEGESTIQFGKSGRSRKVHNSVTSKLLNEDGHAFKVCTRTGITSKVFKAKAHRKSQKTKCRSNQRLKDDQVRAISSVSIAPESVKLVKVRANFTTDSNHLLVEKKLATNGSPEDLYGCADTLITKEAPFVYISNFSKKPVNVSAGQAISQGCNPSASFNKKNRFTKGQLDGIHAHANLLRSIINAEKTPIDKNPFTQTARSEVKTLYDTSRRDYSSKQLPIEPPLEGGPKTAELPEESVPASQLLKEVDISSNLTPTQRYQIQKILKTHQDAFGLEGRLGHYAEEVDIPLVPNTKPISIPPYQASPANREVIDKQMDAWIQLGVIEPSKSPWGAPVFIAY